MTATRIGVVGAGVIARRHVRTLARFDDVQVCAVADVQTDRARELAATVGALAYDDPRAMLDRERLDGVYVCVPPFEAEGRAGEPDGEVARRDQPETAGARRAVDAGDDRPRAVHDEGQDLREADRGRGAARSLLLQVRSGAEHRSGTGEHDDADALVGDPRPEGVVELLEQLAGQRVPVVRGVQRHSRGPGVDVEVDERVVRHGRSSGRRATRRARCASASGSV